MRWTIADRSVYHQGVAPPSARQRILDTAFRLFYARGLRAVGVDTIIAESGVAKATFYKHFPAKDDLVLAYLDRVDGVWTGQLHEAAGVEQPEGGVQDPLAGGTRLGHAPIQPDRSVCYGSEEQTDLSTSS